MIRSLFAGLFLIVRLQGAEQGQLDFSPSLFSVMAAINASGYDAGLQSPYNHPIRPALRKILASKDIPCLAELKRFYRDHKKDSDVLTLSQYVSFALSVDGPPNFKYRVPKNDLPPEINTLEGLQQLMVKFHKEAGIDELWKQAQPAFECVLGGCKDRSGKTIPGYHEPVLMAVRESNAYLRMAMSGSQYTQRFQIYLDVLAAPHQVLTKSLADDFFVVVTPSDEPQVDEIRNAYLRYLADPLVMRQRELLETKKGLGDFAQPAPLLPAIYKDDFVLLTEKSFVKAIESRMLTGPGSTAKRKEMVDRALAEGYILTPFFADALPAYENQEQSMRFYFPDMMKTLDLKKEDKRLEGVQFATTAVTRKIRAAAEPPPPQKSDVDKILDDAEELLKSQKFEDSRTQFLDVLRKTDDKGSHAKAYYGLSRIAIRQNNPELGETLFRKTIELNPEPAVKAWCLVYLGRLADIAGEGEQALEQYKAALAVEGISESAKETAQKGLKGEFRRKQQ